MTRAARTWAVEDELYRDDAPNGPVAGMKPVAWRCVEHDQPNDGHGTETPDPDPDPLIDIDIEVGIQL